MSIRIEVLVTYNWSVDRWNWSVDHKCWSKYCRSRVRCLFCWSLIFKCWSLLLKIPCSVTFLLITYFQVLITFAQKTEFSHFVCWSLTWSVDHCFLKILPKLSSDFVDRPGVNKTDASARLRGAGSDWNPSATLLEKHKAWRRSFSRILLATLANEIAHPAPLGTTRGRMTKRNSAW